MKNKPRSTKYLALLAFMVLLLASCGSESTKVDNQNPRDIIDKKFLAFMDEINTLGNNQPMQWPNTGNCPVTAFDIPGEGMHFEGAVGDFIVNKPGNPVTKANLSAKVAETLGNIESDFKGDESSVILVADKFNRGQFFIGEYIKYLPLIKERYPRYLEWYQDILKEYGQYSHGAIVLNHTNGILKQMYNLSYLGTASNDSGGYSVYKQKIGDKYVLVVPLDINYLNTQAIRQKIVDYIRLIKTATDIGNIVTNMSFALVPCAKLATAQSRGISFEEYVKEVAEDLGKTSNQVLQDWGSEASISPGSDSLIGLSNNPYSAFVQQPSDWVGDIMFVASSGNYSADFPMYPAAARNVISSSSSDYSTHEALSTFSNAAEIMTPGAWFNLDDPLGISGLGLIKEIAYAGTSFSAPATSVFSALDLATTQPSCAEQTRHQSPPYLASGVYNNLDLSNAVNGTTALRLCPH